MALNIEIKAELSQPQFAAVREKSAQVATTELVVLNQTDTFFNCSNGRLKLRQFEDGSAELIAYQRPDCDGPKTSTYTRTPIPHPESFLVAMADSIGIRGVVKKRRELYLLNDTRIHLDEVEGLGTFLELEVVIEEGAIDESVDEEGETGLSPSDRTDPTGEAKAEEIMAILGVDKSWLIAGAYIDLIEARAV
jgi:predicted adenylyl cyclase CyaB